MTARATNAAPLAVVAGASGAIGGAVVQELVRTGWAVIGTYRRARPEPCPGMSWAPFDGADEACTAELRDAAA